MLACVLCTLHTHNGANQHLLHMQQVPLLQCFQDISHGPLVPWESKQNTRSVQKKAMNVTPSICNRPISTHLQPIDCSLLPAVIASNHFKGLIKMNVAVCRYQLRVGARHQLIYTVLTMALKERWIHKTVLTRPASYLQFLQLPLPGAAISATRTQHWKLEDLSLDCLVRIVLHGSVGDKATQSP